MEKPKRDKFKYNARRWWLRRVLIISLFCVLFAGAVLLLPVCGCSPSLPIVDFDNLPCTPQDLQPAEERQAWQNAHFAICTTTDTARLGDKIVFVAAPINIHRNYPDQCIIPELVQLPPLFRLVKQIIDCTGAAIYVVEAAQIGSSEVYFFSPQVVMYPPEISFNGTDDVYSASLTIRVTE